MTLFAAAVAHRRVLLLLSLVLAANCTCDEQLVAAPESIEQTDVFAQKAAAKVDILWVIDNSESMTAEQNKVASRFNGFFNQLLTSLVDYHIGVITTDPADNGVLEAYDGPSVTGCTGCRFLTTDVPCDDPDVDITELTDESEIQNRLRDNCEAALVFRKLIQVGADGTAFEQGFAAAATALGVGTVDPSTGVVTSTVPADNDGFLRDDASLYVVFVSDEEEGAKRDGSPIGYYRRLYESIKGIGNENNVSIAAITGYPLGDDNLPPLDEVCGVLANDTDPREPAVREAFLNFEAGCNDEEAEANEQNAHAETGGRYIELACQTGGVVANMCQADYTTALDALGANAAGLLRKFTLSRFAEMELGSDCTLFTEDDLPLDCDGDGKKGGDLDGPLCVTARAIGSDTTGLVKKDDVTGWRYEASTTSIRFDGTFVPAPGSTVEIRYLLARKNRCQ